MVVLDYNPGSMGGIGRRIGSLSQASDKNERPYLKNK
jgi:hypothetical protein